MGQVMGQGPSCDWIRGSFIKMRPLSLICFETPALKLLDNAAAGRANVTTRSWTYPFPGSSLWGFSTGGIAVKTLKHSGADRGTWSIAAAGILLAGLLMASSPQTSAVEQSAARPEAVAGTQAPGTAVASGQADAEVRAKARPVLEEFQQSPAVFIENQGQWEDASIRFTMNATGANAGLTDQGVRFQLFQREAEQPIGPMGPIRPIGQMEMKTRREAVRGATVRSATKMKEFAIRFQGARAVAPAGDGKSEQVFHYRRGEPARWRENVPSWDAAVYRGLWEGIDLRVTGRRTGIKYEFLVSPGADWRKIRLRYEGVEGLALRADGSLELNLGEGWKPLADAAPYIYQDTAGGRKQVAGKCVLTDAGAGPPENGRICGFEITGPFDPALALVIDPELEWSTYLGGSGGDYGEDIAVDTAGNVFVTGRTTSFGWVSGGLDTTFSGNSDAFVAKLSGSGAHLWSTYLGGDLDDAGYSIALDGTGNVLVTGTTYSTGWVSGGYDTTFNGEYDAFVVKLSGSGAHVWSTYVGGGSRDQGKGIGVNGAGDVFLTGQTNSINWVSGGYDTTYNLGSYPYGGDAFAAKLSKNGAHLWSTYLGGSDDECGYCVKADGSGNVFVTGDTYSSGWIWGGYDTTHDSWDRDAFVVKLSGSGAHLWSTYLGASGDDYGYGMAVDGTGNVFVTGSTFSSGWVSGGFNTTHNGGDDAFVVELSGSGAHLWSTYLGGSANDHGHGIALDGAGNVFVAGDTSSSGWVSGGFDTTLDGGDDAFVAKLSVSGSYLWSSYLGGNAGDAGYAIAVDGARNVFVTGATASSNWVSGGYDTTFNGGGYDAFVCKIKDLTGSLRVTINPPGSVAAGAKWRRAGTANWLDSGYTESGISTGVYTVEFKDIPGWTKPGDVEVTISGGQTTNAGGLYQEPRCTLAWSSYLGGSGDDRGYGIAVDGAGNVFVTGRTDSSGWVSGGFDTAFNGGDGDAFAAKVSGSGAHLWSTYLGGSGDEWGWGIALDRAGNVLVTGETTSSGWVSGGFDTTHNGYYDAFVVKLSGSGSHLWSTYLGGSDNDGGGGIAVDGAGNVLVTGGTWSSGWVSGGFDTTFNYGSDAFAAKLSGSGSHLWSTYLGGIYNDWGYGIAVDATGKVLVTGDTASFGWVSGGFDTTHNGGYDAFVAELSGSGSHLWSTYLGGSDDDHGYGIAMDGAGDVFVTGYTKSAGWVSGGFDTTHNGLQDAFVAELSGSGAHLWSTYLGGSADDQGWSIAVGGAGTAFVTGSTASSDWVSRGFGTTNNGGADAFVAELSGRGAHLWSTYLGGIGGDFGTGIAVDRAGNVFLTGVTESSGWVSGGFDTTYNGGAYDAFVAKILNRLGPCKVASGAWQLYE